MKYLALLVCAAAFALACQAPTINTGASGKGLSVALAFTAPPGAVSPAGASAGADAAPGARLLLADSTYLQVTVVDGLGKTHVQARAISGTSATFSFPDIPPGRCTISATAYANATMVNPMYRNTATVVAGASGGGVALNLLPANFTALAIGANSGSAPGGVITFKYAFGPNVDSLVFFGYAPSQFALQNSRGATVVASGNAVRAADTDGTLYATLYSSAPGTSNGGLMYFFQTAETNPGLIAYYPFNGDANDMSGNGYNGTATAVSYIFDHRSVGSGAASFNGTSSIVTAGSGALTIPAQFSVACWVKISTSIASTSVFAKSASGGFSLYQSGQSLGVFLNAIQSATVMSSNLPYGWHHFVASYDQSTIRIYVDGLASGNVALPGSGVGAGPIALGAANSVYWFGALDSFRVYNRVLSASDVSALYQMTN